MAGTLWRVLATGDETGGVVGALDERCAVGPPMHVHDDADEVFYVLDGNLTSFVGEQHIEAASGAFVYLPRYVHHGFRVDSKEAHIFNFNLESIYKKGGGLPRHVHEREDEMAYVISGRLRVRIGDDSETTAHPGAMIFVPRGTPRSFIADVDNTSFYHGFAPAGFEAIITDSAPTSSQLTTTVVESAPISCRPTHTHFRPPELRGLTKFFFESRSPARGVLMVAPLDIVS